MRYDNARSPRVYVKRPPAPPEAGGTHQPYGLTLTITLNLTLTLNQNLTWWGQRNIAEIICECY